MGFWDTYEAIEQVDAGRRAILRAAGVIDDTRRAWVGADGGVLPSVIYPSDLDAKAELLDGRFTSLDRLVQKSTDRISQGFANGWVELLTRWQKAHAEITSMLSWPAEFVNPRAADDQLNQFSADYNAALTQFQAETHQQLAGAPAPAGPVSTTGQTLERALYIGAALATIVSVGYLINAAKK